MKKIFTLATPVIFGRWPCSVETETGALVGRTTFEVVGAKITPILYNKEL